jgi:hypothetical protein
MNPKRIAGTPVSHRFIQGLVGQVSPPVVVNLRQREPEAVGPTDRARQGKWCRFIFLTSRAAGQELNRRHLRPCACLPVLGWEKQRAGAIQGSFSMVGMKIMRNVPGIPASCAATAAILDGRLPWPPQSLAPLGVQGCIAPHSTRRNSAVHLCRTVASHRSWAGPTSPGRSFAGSAWRRLSYGLVCIVGLRRTAVVPQMRAQQFAGREGMTDRARRHGTQARSGWD